MVTRRTKGHEGAPSRAVDSIDCTGMGTDGTATTNTAMKATANSKAKKRRRLPGMTMHNCGQARVRLNGKTHYLGAWGSAEAHGRYAELIREWEANGREPIGPKAISAGHGSLPRNSTGWTGATLTKRRLKNSMPPSGVMAGMTCFDCE
jgi:hypothetical protein